MFREQNNLEASMGFSKSESVCGILTLHFKDILKALALENFTLTR